MMNLLLNRFIKYLILLSVFVVSQQVAAMTYTASKVAATGFDTTTTPVVWDNKNTWYKNDDDKKLVNIGFTFYLGSIAYTQVRINTNGALDFGADQSFQQAFNNTPLPTASGDRLILPYWDDLADPSVNTVTYDTIGSSPNRRFVATWQGTPRWYGYDWYGNSVYTGSYTFQVVLYEATGEIRFRYGSGDANGSSATIGVQVDSVDYTQYSKPVSPANDVLLTPTFPLISTVAANCSNYHQVVVNFQAPVDPALASNASNYAINNGVSVISATAIGTNTVALQTSTMSVGTSYTLQTLQPVAQSAGFSLPNTLVTTYRDEFNTVSYGNNNGTANWTTNWIEINEADGPAAGDEAVVSDLGSNRVRIQNNGGGAGEGVMREADLSSLTSATLSFLYRRNNLARGRDNVTVDISNDNFATWKTLAKYSGAGRGTQSDTEYVAANFTIPSKYLTATARIRFLSSSNLSNTEQVYFDDVQIQGPTANICPIEPNHYAISYPNGNPGVTCEALAVRITAHDSLHNPMTPPAGTTITLSTSPAAGGWALKSGNGTFTAPNQYTFDGIETYAEFWLTQTTPTTAPYIDINVTDGIATDIEGDPLEDVHAQFDDAIFRFFAAGTPDSIGTQIAGKAASIAPGNQTLELRAVQTNTTTKKCEAALVGTTSVDMAYECNNPATCSASNALSMTTTAGTQTIARNNNGSVTSYTPLNMVFDANGVAPFDMTYSDVGQMTLHARKTLTAGVGLPPSTAKILVGASNVHIVRPFGFDMDFSGQRAADYLDDGILNNSTGTDSSYAVNASGSKFQIAGANFPLSLRAVAWNAADDTNNDGVPDACADLSNNATTSNFGNEVTAAVPANVTLSNTLVAPATGVAGTLSTSLNGASFSSGVGSKTISWNEVGIMNLSASLPSYLGSGQNIEGNVCNVGRFYPNNFVIQNPTLTNRSDIAACPDTFTYMGENFTLNYNLQATSATPPGTVTKNYIGSFAKLDPAVLAQMNYGATDSGTNLTARLGVASAGTFVAGAAPVNATLQFKRNATPDGAYKTLKIGIAPVDSDSVGLLASSLNLSLDGGPNTHGLLGQTDLRYGRLNLQNNFGSELQAQTLPLSTEYYDSAAADFVTNVDDSCTTRSPADVLLYNDQEPKSTRALNNPTIKVNGANTTTLTSISAFVGGKATMSFSAPGAEGYVDVGVQTPSWLLSNLDGIDQGVQGPGSHCTPGLAATDPAFISGCVADSNIVDDVPLARLNFGIFKGSNHILYIREAY